MARHIILAPKTPAGQSVVSAYGAVWHVTKRARERSGPWLLLESCDDLRWVHGTHDTDFSVEPCDRRVAESQIGVTSRTVLQSVGLSPSGELAANLAADVSVSRRTLPDSAALNRRPRAWYCPACHRQRRGRRPAIREHWCEIGDRHEPLYTPARYWVVICCLLRLIIVANWWASGSIWEAIKILLGAMTYDPRRPVTTW
jgi:hypothetical protein